MKKFSSFIALILAILAFSFVGVNAQSFSGRGNVSASSIERQVFKEIIRLPYYGLFDNIKFEVKGNTVILHGKVLSLGTRKSAERVVKRIPGVQRVVNNIENLPLSSFDNSIRRRIVSEFVKSPGVYPYIREPNPSVRIIVDGGRVSLEGFVSNRGTANLMNILANGVSGVFSVDNNLVIENNRAR
ncbi:MAG: BON domain-containing protein [Pyrinomonadaceae bacterium]